MGIFGGDNTANANLKINYHGEDAVKGLQRLKGTIGTVISALAIKQVIDYSTKLVMMGAQAERNEKVFRSMATARNIDADRMINKMNEVTRGLIQNDDLMALATKELINNLSSDEIVAWMELASNYAKSIGADVKTTLDTTFQALASGNARAIKTMGVDFKIVNGEVKADLGELKKKSDELAKSLGGEDSALDAMVKLNKETKELGETIGKAIAPAWETAVGWASKLVELTEWYFALTSKRDEMIGKMMAGKSIEQIQVEELIEAAKKEKDFTIAREKRIELEDKLNRINQKAFETSKGIEIINKNGKMEEIKLTEEQIRVGGLLFGKRRGELELMIQMIRQADQESRKKIGSEIKGPKSSAEIEAEEKAAKDRYDKMKKLVQDKNEAESSIYWDGVKARIELEENAKNKFQDIQNEYTKYLEGINNTRSDMQEQLLFDSMSKEQQYIFQQANIYAEQYNIGIITYEQYLDKLEELGKDNALRRVENEISAANAIINSISTVSSAAQTLSNALADRDIRNLDKRKMSRKEYEKEMEKIEAERLERNRNFARMQQAIILAETISQTAAAVVAALAKNAPIYKWIDAAAVAATGAIQIATIQAQNFARGFVGEADRNTRRDDIPALIGRNEAVVPGAQFAMHRQDVQAIINNTANTAAGMSKIRGGSVTYVFNSVTTEQILQAQKNNERRNRIGTRI